MSGDANFVSKTGYTYILGSRPNGTLYIGVTSDLRKRIWQHREGIVDGFTQDHSVKSLLHYEVFDDIVYAIAREKQLKNWKRQWKIALIRKQNPDWQDLWQHINQ